MKRSSAWIIAVIVVTMITGLIPLGQSFVPAQSNAANQASLHLVPSLAPDANQPAPVAQGPGPALLEAPFEAARSAAIPAQTSPSSDRLPIRPPPASLQEDTRPQPPGLQAAGLAASPPADRFWIDQQAPVVADGIGVKDAIPGGYGDWTNSFIIHQAERLQAVDWNGDGQREILAYDGHVPTVLGEELEPAVRPMAPSPATDVLAHDVTDDGTRDLIVGMSDGVVIVDGATGVTLAEHTNPFSRTPGLVALETDNTLKLGVYERVPGEGDLFSQSLVHLFEVPDAQTLDPIVSEPVRLDGSIIDAREGEHGALLLAHVSESGVGWREVALVDWEGTVSWIHEGTGILEVGWSQETPDTVYWAQRSTLSVVDATSGDIQWETPIPGSGAFAVAAAGDITGNGQTDYAIGKGGLSPLTNPVQSDVYVVDGETRALEPVGRIPGLPLHITVEDATQNGHGDIVAATHQAGPISLVASGDLAPGNVHTTASTVALWEGPSLEPTWIRPMPLVGETGWVHAPHRGIAVADVLPGGDPGIVVQRTWHGALETIDPSSGDVVTRVDQPGAIYDADSGPCGPVAAHLTGHASLPEATVRLGSVPLHAYAMEDCGAIIGTFTGVQRLLPDGTVLWEESHDIPIQDLAVNEENDQLAVTLGDGRILARSLDTGEVSWVYTQNPPGTLARVEITPQENGYLIGSCDSTGVTVLNPLTREPLTSVGVSSPYISHLDAQTGQAAWTHEFDGVCPYGLRTVQEEVGFLTWNPEPNTGEVHRVDSTGLLQATPVEGTPWALRVLGEELVVSLEQDDAWRVERIDPQAAVVSTAPTRGEPIGVGTWGEDEIAVATREGRFTLLLDTWEGEEIGSLEGLGIYGAPGVGVRLPPHEVSIGQCADEGQGLVCWGRAGQASLAHLVPE